MISIRYHPTSAFERCSGFVRADVLFQIAHV
jgi:hypothetical protein